MENTTKLNQAKAKLNKLREQQLKYLENSEDDFAKIVKDLTIPQIEKMTNEEVIGFNKYEDGKKYLEEPEFETSDELACYLRSVFIFLVKTYEFGLDMDNKVKELDEIAEETEHILKEAFGLNDDVNPIEVISSAIDKGLVKAQENGNTDQYKKILKSRETFNETFTLDRMKDLYKTIDPENLKADAKSTRSVDIYKKYLRVQQHLGSRYDLCSVHDLELRFLPEEYHEMNNLFIFACMKYISKLLDSRQYDSDTGLFVSQLTTNLFMLHTDKLLEEHKKLLIDNIKEFLDMLR